MQSTTMLPVEETPNYPLLTPEQEVELSKRIHAGDAHASSTLIMSNMRLVWSIARKFQHVVDRVRPKVEMIDLVQEGYAGLVRAAGDFQWELGYKFSTYATTRIRGAIMDALVKQADMIRLPKEMVSERRKVWQAREKILAAGGEETTISRVAQESSLSEAAVARVLKYDSISPVSLDLLSDVAPAGVDFLANYRYPDPAVAYERQWAVERLLECVGGLESRLRKILALRFGLQDGESRSHEEVAQIIGVSRNRVRQLELRALQQLYFQHGGELRGLLGVRLLDYEPSAN